MRLTNCSHEARVGVRPFIVYPTRIKSQSSKQTSRSWKSRAWHHFSFISGLSQQLSPQPKHTLEIRPAPMACLSPTQNMAMACCEHQQIPVASKDMNEIDKLVAEKKKKADTLGITFGLSHHQPLPVSAASGFGQGCHARKV